VRNPSREKGRPDFYQPGLRFSREGGAAETLALRREHIRISFLVVAENSSGYQLCFPREAFLFFFRASDGVLGLAILCQRPLYDLKNLRRSARRQPLAPMKIHELTDLIFVVDHQWIGRPIKVWDEIRRHSRSGCATSGSLPHRDQALLIFRPDVELLDSALFGGGRARRVDQADESGRRPPQPADLPDGGPARCTLTGLTLTLTHDPIIALGLRLVPVLRRAVADGRAPRRRLR